MVKRADVAPVEDGFLQIDGSARISALASTRCQIISPSTKNLL